MSLRSYSKSTSYSTPAARVEYIAQPTQNTSSYSTPEYVYTEAPRQKVTMWSLSSAFYKGLKGIVATSSVAGLIIPTALIMTGGVFIYLQFQPTIVDQVKEYAGLYEQGTTAVVGDNYVTDRLQYVSNPGADYFQRVSQLALNSSLLKPDEYSLNYKGTMYLTIPSLGFNRLPIKSNVQSNSKDIYDQVLSTSLAHFKGTSVPGSDNASNIVIYGHSAGGGYNPNPNDVLGAFTFLQDLKVGDVIILEADGVEHKYKMSRSKKVEPSDTSVVTGTPGKETLTLFTCHPPGNNSSRLVISAIPVT